jgi:hypothetical protein
MHSTPHEWLADNKCGKRDKPGRHTAGSTC